MFLVDVISVVVIISRVLVFCRWWRVIMCGVLCCWSFVFRIPASLPPGPDSRCPVGVCVCCLCI